jgi:hypothetical protein
MVGTVSVIVSATAGATGGASAGANAGDPAVSISMASPFVIVIVDDICLYLGLYNRYSDVLSLMMDSIASTSAGCWIAAFARS